jgi:hypothetical protein
MFPRFNFSALTAAAAVFAILLIPGTSRAEGISSVFGFGPSDARTHKPSLILGLGGSEWMFSLGIIFNSEYAKDDFVDTPIPHSDYTDLGTKRIGNTMGFDVSKSLEILESFPSLVVSGGLYFENTSHIVRSNVTGLLWSQDDKTATLPGVGMGIIFRPEGKFNFGVDFHSIKGFGLSLLMKL